MTPRTLGLYGPTGAGKTTQAGEYAKDVKRRTGKNSLLVAADMGGYDSIQSLVDVGTVRIVEFTDVDDPWVWINAAVSGDLLTPDIGLIIFDSGTSMSEALLSSAAKLSAKNVQVGSQKVLKFSIPGTGLTIGANTESHYMVVQSFMLDAIWKSTWLSRTGVEALWTFGEMRDPDTGITGPKIAGKALTAAMPKWLKYTLRLQAVVEAGQSPRHLLQLQAQPDPSGLGHSLANARYPLDADTPCPPFIEPASIPAFWALIDEAQSQALTKAAAEFGGR